MYKKQMTFQRVVCLLCIIASAVAFLYALGMMTDLYDMLYTMIPDPEELDNAKVAGARIYYDMQDFNHTLLKASIGLILLACLLFITNTHSRRKYYIGNCVVVGLNAVAAVAASVWTHIQVAAYKTQYLTTVDFAQLERRLSRAGTYTDSTFWFDIHWFVCVFLLVAAGLLVYNLIWKMNLMKGEAELLQGSGADAEISGKAV